MNLVPLMKLKNRLINPVNIRKFNKSVSIIKKRLTTPIGNIEKPIGLKPPVKVTFEMKVLGIKIAYEREKNELFGKDLVIQDHLSNNEISYVIEGPFLTKKVNHNGKLITLSRIPVDVVYDGLKKEKKIVSHCVTKLK